VNVSTSWRRGAALGLILAAGMAVWTGPDAVAQIPDKFKNLKVLPKNVSKEELTQTMRGFSFALGVRCGYCHAEEKQLSEGGEHRLDFASDAKHEKGTARQMLRMVRGINGQYLGKLDPKPTISVQCVTCHHGIPRPEPLADLLKRAVADSGTTVAVARYRSLRERYYGSASYDFGEGSLNTLAEGLMREGKSAEALTFLELNAEHFAESGWLQGLLGEAYAATGDTTRARAALEKALASQPDNPRLKRRLEQLGPASH
jgi:tetratricopeptide (TPR) repeat protein